MAELKDFTGQTVSQLSDFVSEITTTPMWSRASAQNLAAHGALMSDRPIETYDTIMAQMYNTGRSQANSDIVSRLTQEAEAQVDEAMGRMLAEGADPVALSQAYQNMEAPSQHQMLEEQAILAPMRNETESSEKFRLDTGERLKQINARRVLVQEAMQEELAKRDQGVLATVLDIAEFFVPVAGQRPTAQLMDELDDGSQFQSYVLNGEAKAELAKKLLEVPESQRLALSQKLIEAVNNSPNAVLFTENKLESAELLRIMLDEGYYTDVDKWIDTTMSVLDASALGWPLARALGVFKAVKTAAKIASSRKGEDLITSMASRDVVKAPVAPHSASQALKDTNPDKYRALHAAALEDETEEIAQAAYGVSRLDVLGHDIASEVLQPFDIVKNKVDIPIAPPRINIHNPNPRVMDVASANGTVYLSEAERLGVTSRVINDFRNATGLQPRTAMTREGTVIDGVTGEFSNNTVNIRAVYGSVDGGFSSVDDAIERTKISLRQFGVDDSDISILMRDGEHFTPVPSVLAPKDADNFLVQVNFPYRVAAEDVPLAPFNVKWNLFDRFEWATSSKHGSAQRHLLPLSSMVEKEFVGGAARAVDRGSLLAKEMLQLGQKFTDLYDKLPDSRKAALFEEIKRANFEGRVPNRARLISEGFEPEELVALDRWKDYWDTAYHLENRDKRTTLHNQGYQRVENSNGTRLDAKPIKRDAPVRTNKVYDPDTDSIVSLSKEEMDELYDKGGHLSSMKTAVELAGEVVGGKDGIPLLVRNQPGGTVSRGYRDWDTVLDYRQGYFSVRYDAEYFIVKEITGPGGTTYERAVAISGDLASANKRAAQLGSDGGTYRVRADVRGEGRDDMVDSIHLSGGRSSQRVRGQRLEDATDDNTSGFDMQYIMNPVDTMVNTSRGLADRVAMREFMETSKVRFLRQFGHMLPKDKSGNPLWPSKVEHIGREGELTSKQLADARTTWEAINYWENGYINAIDDGWKASLRALAQMAGGRGMTKVEKAAFWASELAGPTTSMRRAAFNLYLVLNPARQVLVQSHQAVQLAALRPVYASTRMHSDFAALTLARLSDGADKVPSGVIAMTGRTKEEFRDMYQAYLDSGLSASIDRQNLIRGSLLSSADDLAYRGKAAEAVLAKAGRGVNTVMNASRRAGFDLGEEVNMMTSFLAFYDEALTANKVKKLSVEQLDSVVAKARDFTYGMNFADDMPYNQNWLSMIFQFAQVPHKAAAQFTFNRGMSAKEKFQMGVFNAAMYGVPPGSLLYNMVEPYTADLTDDQREAVIFGLESYALNRAISGLVGEETKLSYSALQATDSITMYNLVESLMTMDMMSLLAETPSGSLLFGNNPRISEWARSVAKLTNFMDEDTIDETTLPMVLEQTFGLASGFSNAFKARLAYQMQEKTNAYGRVTKDGVNLAVVIGTALGFETQEEMLKRYVTQEVYENSKEFEEDVKNQYRHTKLQLKRVGKDLKDPNTVAEVMTFGWAALGNSTRAKEIWEQQMRRDVEAGDHTIFNSLLRASTGGMMSRDERDQLARSLPPELRDELLEIFEYTDTEQ